MKIIGKYGKLSLTVVVNIDLGTQHLCSEVQVFDFKCGRESVQSPL